MLRQKLIIEIPQYFLISLTLLIQRMGFIKNKIGNNYFSTSLMLIQKKYIIINLLIETLSN